MAKLQAFREAEHLCLRRGRYDDWTEEGHRLCWRCMADDIRQEVRRDKAAVMRAHGYSVQEE